MKKARARNDPGRGLVVASDGVQSAPVVTMLSPLMLG